MTSPATTADIESRWRPLTSQESTIAETRLEDAWRKLKRDVSTLEARMVGNDDLTADTVRVLADSVIRVLEALDRGSRKGSVSVDDANVSWEDPTLRREPYFTEAELGDLSETGTRKKARAFSVLPS